MKISLSFKKHCEVLDENHKNFFIQSSAPLAVLKIDTDEGISGWGEPVVEGRAETVKAAVNELTDYLIRGEIRTILKISGKRFIEVDFYRGGPILMSAISGIEQALWDIKGKYVDVRGQNVSCRAPLRKLKSYSHGWRR